MKDHKPVVIEEFRGLWSNGDEETCPIDHFSDCNNIAYSESAFETRPGINTYSDAGGIFRSGVLRMYNYVTENGESLLVLVEGGKIYHAMLDGSDTVYEILSIPEMEDFDFHSFGNKAYITPFKNYTWPTGENYQLGLPNEAVYVYKGDGTPARKAAGYPPENGGSSNLVGYNGEQVGEVTQGIHILAVASANSTDLSGLGPEGLSVVYAPGDFVISLNNIPVGEAATTKRNIYMTKAIPPEEWHPDSDGDLRDEYDFYFVQSIDDNTTKSTTVNIKDEQDPDDPTDTHYLHEKFGVAPHVPGGVLNTPTNSAMYAINSATDGHCDLGLHVLGVVYETDTGYLTAPGPQYFAVQTFVNDQKAIELHNIPVPTNPAVVKKHIVSTVALGQFNGNNQAEALEYQMFFVPDGEMAPDATDKMLNYYDAELFDDASHLFDNFSEIPAGVGLGSYNGRMAVWGMNGGDDKVMRSLCYFSFKDEPEAIDQVEGFVKFPVDGKPLTNGQEFRDSFYLFKQTKTAVTTDNGQSPAFWNDRGSAIILDHGIGASVHGICKVLDSDGVNVDYILVVDWTGIMVFTGRYIFPSLTWKIENLWHSLARNFFATIQILSDSIEHRLYMILPNKQMLYGDWSDGLDSKKIKWSPWTFDIETTTIALVESNKLLIGSDDLTGEARRARGL